MTSQRQRLPFPEKIHERNVIVYTYPFYREQIVYFLSEVIALVANEGAIPTSFDLMGIPRGITRTGKKERKPIRVKKIRRRISLRGKETFDRSIAFASIASIHDMPFHYKRNNLLRFLSFTSVPRTMEYNYLRRIPGYAYSQRKRACTKRLSVKKTVFLPILSRRDER